MGQLKKKFIADKAIDGSKILLLNNQPVKALIDNGQAEQEIFKFDSGNRLVLYTAYVPGFQVDPEQVTNKQTVDAAVNAEASARTKADNGLSSRLDTIEGSNTTAGSIAKAQKDSQDYADGIVGSEAAARAKADNTLQSAIDVEKGRIDAILSASDADKDSFAEIVSLINSVDTTNDNAFASYVLSNDAALADEILTRSTQVEGLDAALADEIATRSTQTQTLGNSIYDEQVARENADATLSSRLDVIEGDGYTVGSITYYVQQLSNNIGNVQNAVDAEESRALQAESDLQSLVDSLEMIVTENPDSLSAKMGAITGSDTVAPANGLPGSMLYYRAELMQYTNDQVTNEFDRAFAAESSLDGRLVVLEGPDTLAGSVAKAQKDSQDYAESLVNAESAARSKANGILETAINVEKGRIDAILSASTADKDSFAEIVTLINSVDTTNDTAFAGYVLSNDAALAQEVSDRQSGDNALSLRLDALEAVAHYKESFTLTSQQISDGYIDLQVEAAGNSTIVFVGRLGAWEGVDYSVSVVDGVTRLTWMGELAASGASELVADDVVYVKYMK